MHRIPILPCAIRIGLPSVSEDEQSALRWGPYVKDESRASIMVPEAYCGQDFHCKGNLCNFYPCMKRISVPQALEQVHLQLDKLPG